MKRIIIMALMGFLASTQNILVLPSSNEKTSVEIVIEKLQQEEKAAQSLAVVNVKPQQQMKISTESLNKKVQKNIKRLDLCDEQLMTIAQEACTVDGIMSTGELLFTKVQCLITLQSSFKKVVLDVLTLHKYKNKFAKIHFETLCKNMNLAYDIIDTAISNAQQVLNSLFSKKNKHTLESLAKLTHESNESITQWQTQALSIALPFLSSTHKEMALLNFATLSIS